MDLEKYMKNKLLLAFLSMTALALPGWAAEGLRGASVSPSEARSMGVERQAALERCQADPEKCRAERLARREQCRADPEKCRADRQARREKWCAENAEKCKELRARMAQRRELCKANPEQCRKEREARFAERFKKADADGNGVLSRAEAEKGMRRLVRHFDTVDADRDGQITMDEIRAARKSRGARKGRSL
jgi:hypothetical protein